MNLPLEKDREQAGSAEAAGWAGAAYEAARRTAIVAGAFSAVVAALLAYDYSRRPVQDPLDSPGMKTLKAALTQQPANEAIKEQIRLLDQDLRRQAIRQRVFAARGGVLLAGGLLVLLLAARAAAALRRKLPNPPLLAASEDRQSQWAASARWAVAGLAVVLLAVAAGFVAAYRPLPASVAEQPPSRQPMVPGKPAPPAAPEKPAAPFVLGPPPAAAAVAKAWPRFRGPAGSGISAFADVPETWDARSGKNILWKTPVPLPGNGSPVVWGNRVFLSGASAKRREVYCFGAGDGKLLWQQEVPATAESNKPLKVSQVTFDMTGFAAPTMATDGRLALAIFANGDVAAFAFDGRLVWSRSLGIPENSYGHAASPCVYQNLLLVPLDQGHEEEEKSKLLALDLSTGKTVWAERREMPNGWSSPIIIRAGGVDQLITTNSPWVIAYGLPEGKEIWRAKCLQGEVGPSPVFANGIVYAPASEYSHLCALAPDGQGDVSDTKLLWQGDEDPAEVCSPLVTDKFAFVIGSGMLTCCDAMKGQVFWKEKLKGTHSASPALAGNRLYIISRQGKVLVIEPDAKQCRRVGEADLGEPCVTSPAFQPGRIYLRGKRHLFCIGRKP